MNTSESESDKKTYNKNQPQVKNIRTIRQNFGLLRTASLLQFSFSCWQFRWLRRNAQRSEQSCQNGESLPKSQR